MFYYCSSLPAFNKPLPKVNNASYMFYQCPNLEYFTPGETLPSLRYADYMFKGCSKLKVFSVNTDIITDADSMFADCSSLTQFQGTL